MMKRSKSFSSRVLPPKRGGSTDLRVTARDLRVTAHQETVPEAIMKHIQKRADVQIIVYYEQYREQFFIKCKRLQQYLYKSPGIKEKYVSDHDSHFKYALQHLFLDLFRRGVILPNSYENLKQDAVEEIQKWVLGWIHRKLLYDKANVEEKDQVDKVGRILNDMSRYVKTIQVEELPF